MRWRLASSMNTEYSLRALISPSRAPNNPASGPDIPASKLGFCRSNAASNVEPERGKPEMKWMAAKASSRPKVRTMPLDADIEPSDQPIATFEFRVIRCREVPVGFGRRETGRAIYIYVNVFGAQYFCRDPRKVGQWRRYGHAGGMSRALSSRRRGLTDNATDERPGATELCQPQCPRLPSDPTTNPGPRGVAARQLGMVRPQPTIPGVRCLLVNSNATLTF